MKDANERRQARFRPDDDEVLARLVASPAVAGTMVFPRSDGMYAGVTPDFVGILREAGVAVAYSTDPASARGWQHKSGIEQVLPGIVIAVGDAGTVLSTIDGVAYVVRVLLDRARPGARLSLDVGRWESPDGTSIEWVELEATGDAQSNERMVRETLRRFFER